LIGMTTQKRTAAATLALITRTNERIAARLRQHGWVCFSPETVAKVGIVPVVLSGDPDGDPCAGGCSNPAVHAEGGHDV
jgi:hypothetical protein